MFCDGHPLPLPEGPPATTPPPRAVSRPQHVVLTDANGIRHECVAEAFDSKHQVFILICPQAILIKKVVLVNV